jgi:hypothetical protein
MLPAFALLAMLGASGMYLDGGSRCRRIRRGSRKVETAKQARRREERAVARWLATQKGANRPPVPLSAGD